MALRGPGFGPTLVRLFILRWALTLVALLASGAAGAAVPETQPARVQGGDAQSGAARSSAPKGQPGRTGRRADATCDNTDELADSADPGFSHGFAAESVWLSHQLMWLAFDLPSDAHREEVAPPAPTTTRRPLLVATRPSPREAGDVRQPRAPPSVA